jgi:hypothetical protein
MNTNKSLLTSDHRFLDEAGDTTFFGKGKVNIVGQIGVSKCFILGSVKFKSPLDTIRMQIRQMIATVEQDTYFSDIPSIRKKVQSSGFYFHATDDIPEVRKMLYDYIGTLDCSFEAVVGRKIERIFQQKHNGKQSEFYADMLSHLLKNKLNQEGKLVLNIAQRANSTKHNNLVLALNKGIQRYKNTDQNRIVKRQVNFNVQPYENEPLLCITDYFCWAVQRVFERGELRYYNYLKDKISMIIDLYDSQNWERSQNYYSPKHPLSVNNHIK